MRGESPAAPKETRSVVFFCCKIYFVFNCLFFSTTGFFFLHHLDKKSVEFVHKQLGESKEEDAEIENNVQTLSLSLHHYPSSES